MGWAWACVSLLHARLGRSRLGLIGGCRGRETGVSFWYLEQSSDGRSIADETATICQPCAWRSRRVVPVVVVSIAMCPLRRIGMRIYALDGAVYPQRIQHPS